MSRADLLAVALLTWAALAIAVAWALTRWFRIQRALDERDG